MRYKVGAERTVSVPRHAERPEGGTIDVPSGPVHAVGREGAAVAAVYGWDFETAPGLAKCPRCSVAIEGTA